MSVQLKQTNNGRILEVSVTNKLMAEDYKQLVPEFERLIREHGKISLLFEMLDFHGWEAGAIWQDIKFDLKHFADIERLAMVGDKKWEKWMSEFCRPFTTAKIRYFDQSERNEAGRWLAGEPVEVAGHSPKQAM